LFIAKKTTQHKFKCPLLFRKLNAAEYNLVGNAIKFTDSGEVVVATDVEVIEAKRIQIHFSVRDTGIGIPENKLDAIFEAFNQGDASMTRRFGGTGLGLSISIRLVELMKGEIWADSIDGEGSTFHFTLDLNLDSETSLEPKIKASTQLKGKEVIVVSGNKSTRTAVRKALEPWSLSPRLCSDLSEAERELSKNQSNQQLIIIDTALDDPNKLLSNLERIPGGSDHPIRPYRQSRGTDWSKCVSNRINDHQTI
jgi:hypothetical protein